MGLFQKLRCTLLGVSMVCCMQSLAPAPVSALVLDESQNFFSTLYNNYNGLPTSEANTIAQTEDGFIWIGSYGSLLRYDGKEFTSFEDPGLSSILSLFKDSKGRLWIGTNNNGVALYENRTFTFIDASAYSSSYSVRAISETENGDILIGTTTGMYLIDANQEVIPLLNSQLSTAYITKLSSIGENRTLVMTKSGSFAIMNGTEIEYFVEYNEDWMLALPLCGMLVGDDILIGTAENYLLQFSLKEGNSEFETISTPGLEYINTLTEDSSGKIWITSDTGVGYLDQEGTLRHLNYIQGGESIEYIMEDQEGNFWLASSKSGVIKLSPSLFQNVSGALADLPQINAVEILDGLIYIVSINGIDIIDQETLQVVENDLTKRYRGTYIRCVEKDSSGKLWFSSYSDDALIEYNPKTGELNTYNQENGLDYGRIRSTTATSDGKVWVATGNGVYVVENGTITHHFGREDGLDNLEILTIAESNDGRIFLGTDGAGGYIIENGEVTHEINRNHGLPSDIIMRMEPDPVSNGMWIVSGTSISYYDEDNNLINIDKFPYGNNFDLLFYQENIIILSSNGIYFTTRDAMLASGSHLDYIHRSHLDGLFSSLVPNSFSKIEDGILYLCGTQNLSTISLITESESSTYTPQIQLISISVHDTEIVPSKENHFILPNTANYIECDVLIPTYSLHDYNVSYSMVGYDQMPRSTSYENFKNPTYTNLPGGEYRFVVELTDNRTNKVISRGEFTIEKEFTLYENPAFQIFLTFSIFVLIGFLFLLVIKMRERKQKEEKRIQQALLDEVVEVFSNVIDVKDKYTNGHSRRVALYTREIAVAMGFSPERINELYKIALLHDVGKIAIPDAVLNKNSKLTEEELVIMRSHTKNGADILHSIATWPEIAVGAKYHHERYDGKGAYGLTGTKIPLDARIICVADAFDAMYSSRSYSKKVELSYALSQLEENKGTQFDPEIVDIFLAVIHDKKVEHVLINVK